MNIPSATYRLQFNADFTFQDAEKLLGYLRELGISHIYASPLMQARRGSNHGYDVTDPNRINPEIGTRQEFEQFVAQLGVHQLGLMLDIVPNHMAASLENPWWVDVLTNGEASEYAPYFDINWDAGSGKVLLPILQKPYGETLDAGDLRVEADALVYNDQRLPIRNPNGAPSNVDELDRLISSQAYRVAYWRKAADAINYRRFFDINDLVAMRTQLQSVFEATHAAVFEFVNRGWVQALRIDHIDGLLDPMGYLDRLPPVYVVVEKILGGREQLRTDWRTHGTTGYDFLNIVNGPFVDVSGYEKLCRIHGTFIGESASANNVAQWRKCQVMKQLFATEVEALTDRLVALADQHRNARDLTRAEIRQAFVALTSCLPVYRTYIRELSVSGCDRAHIEQAFAAAGCSSLCSALKFLREVLLIEPPYYLSERRHDYLCFVQRWQQFTGAVTAKGLEDTAFYVFNPLISLNDVGGDAVDPCVYLGVENFHQRNLERRAHHPATMNATSTHDTKRSEDVRARIDVLSEIPEEWERCLRRWSRWNTSERAPDPNEQVLIYQTLLGAWPISRDRLYAYIIKALREAKTNTSWLNIDLAYERKVLEFVDQLTDPKRSERFLRDFLRLHQKVSYFGMLNSLAQTLLKIASPGVPDFYQGTEMWDYSLADPDNRRPVNFESRIAALTALNRHAEPKELLRDWSDGRIKMFVIAKALSFRRDHLDVFLDGEYLPLEVRGARSGHVIAFARRLADRWVIVAVPRLCSQLTRAGKPPLGQRVWSNTSVLIPADCPSALQNIFTGQPVTSFNVSAILSDFPVALLSAGGAVG